MADTTQTDPVADRLAEIRERWAKIETVECRDGVVPEQRGTTRADPAEWRADVPALVATVEAVLARHQPGRIVVLGALCPKHEPHRHFSITSTEAAGIVACQDCTATVYGSCTGCGPQMRLDSCPARTTISRELLGEGGDGG